MNNNNNKSTFCSCWFLRMIYSSPLFPRYVSCHVRMRWAPPPTQIWSLDWRIQTQSLDSSHIPLLVAGRWFPRCRPLDSWLWPQTGWRVRIGCGRRYGRWCGKWSLHPLLPPLKWSESSLTQFGHRWIWYQSIPPKPSEPNERIDQFQFKISNLIQSSETTGLPILSYISELEEDVPKI